MLAQLLPCQRDPRMAYQRPQQSVLACGEQQPQRRRGVPRLGGDGVRPDRDPLARPELAGAP
jgi:hypothetical protein